jgi:Cellulase (glycosyl hydrolase family 5)
MICRAFLAAIMVIAAASTSFAQKAADCAAGTNGGTGSFRVSGGRIIAPNDQPFIAKGINIYPEQLEKQGVSAVLDMFPGINLVRLNIFELDKYTAAKLKPLVEQLTRRGVVVELEDHNYPAVLYGSELAKAAAWYASLASAFIDNPYVIFGAQNEPDATRGPSAVDTEISTIYQAIRATGNNTLILMNPIGGMSVSGLNSSVYAKMTGVAWDIHEYSWVGKLSEDVSVQLAALRRNVSSAQAIVSADGAIPVIIGEYGWACCTGVDKGWKAVLNAVQASGLGSAAWAWTSGGTLELLLNDHRGSPSYGLTDFGEMVKRMFAATPTSRAGPACAKAG